MCVCVCVFIKLHITAQSGPVILVILCHLRVCVCVFSSPLFWTSSSLDVPAGVTQEEGHTGFLTHLPLAVHAFIFLAKRIHQFLSLVDREIEFCVLRAVLMGTKSCTKILYKNLKLFDKIFVRKSWRRRFRNAPYGEKILMGKSYVWA